MRSMRIVAFHHSLYSNWNHGNAHFLRALMRPLRGVSASSTSRATGGA